jgi:hypothetical protein
MRLLPLQTRTRYAVLCLTAIVLDVGALLAPEHSKLRVTLFVLAAAVWVYVIYSTWKTRRNW